MPTTLKTSTDLIAAPQIQAALRGAWALGFTVTITDTETEHGLIVQTTKKVGLQRLRGQYTISSYSLRNESDWVYAVAEGIRSCVHRLTESMMQ